jgi:hypothetical protein
MLAALRSPGTASVRPSPAGIAGVETMAGEEKLEDAAGRAGYANVSATTAHEGLTWEGTGRRGATAQHTTPRACTSTRRPGSFATR